MAIFLPVDVKPYEQAPANGKAFTYKELRDFIGGNIEIVPLPSGLSIIVHEEGKLIGLAENPYATQIWKREYPIDQYPDNNDELIAGSAIVVTDAELAENEE